MSQSIHNSCVPTLHFYHSRNLTRHYYVLEYKVAELIKRGWSRQDVAGLAGGNLLRVLRGAERSAWAMRINGARPSMALYDKRPDLPVTTIGREQEEL